MGVFRNLKSLNIGRNHITVKGIEKLVETGLKLKVLGISDINIRKTDAILKLNVLDDYLEDLDISWCNIGDVGVKQIVENLNNIRRINLNGNNISNDGLELILDKFKNLHALSVGYNEGVNKPEYSDKLGSLEYLDITDSDLDSEFLRGIGEDLTVFKMSAIDITDDFVEIMVTKFTKLTEFFLSGNYCDEIPEISDANLKKLLKGLKGLTSLSIDCFTRSPEVYDYKGIIDVIVKELPNLEYLNIECEGLKDENLVQIVSGLRKLTHLIIPENDFTDNGFREIAKINNNLIFLDISSKNITLDGISEISKLSKLLHLKIRNIDIRGISTKTLKKSPRINWAYY